MLTFSLLSLKLLNIGENGRDIDDIRYRVDVLTN